MDDEPPPPPVVVVVPRELTKLAMAAMPAAFASAPPDPPGATTASMGERGFTTAQAKPVYPLLSTASRASRAGTEAVVEGEVREKVGGKVAPENRSVNPSGRPPLLPLLLLVLVAMENRDFCMAGVARVLHARGDSTPDVVVVVVVVEAAGKRLEGHVPPTATALPAVAPPMYPRAA